MRKRDFEMEGNVTITKREYFELCCRDTKFAMLEAAGVDNWNGYGGESFRPDGEASLKDRVKELEEKIKAM
jgi:hypothetical protein